MSESQLGNIGSKTRSLGQIKNKPYVHSRGHKFEAGSRGIITRSLGQIIENLL